MKLTKKSETSTKITFTYDKPPGVVEGYVYYAEGSRVSKTMNPNDLEVTFGKVPSGQYAVEAVGFDTIERAEYPEPAAPTDASPIGFLSNAAYFPASNADKYGVVSTVATPGAGFDGLKIFYRTGITCQTTGSTNISEATCLANGWEMRDTAGTVLRNAGFGGVLADPGNSGYQNAWCTAMYTRLQQVGAAGVWIDDVNPRITSLSGGAWPAAYPNNAAYEAAIIDFAQAVKPFCDARSVRCAYNTGVPADDAAAIANKSWWPRIGPYAHYLTKEYWLIRGDGSLRKTGAEYFNHWDEHRASHMACQTAGCGFLPLSGGGGTAGQRYVLGTFMLDWTGELEDGSAMWSPTDSYNTTTDPWVQFYADAVALGAPTAAATSSANVHSRQFENGKLTVDSGAATAAITL